MFYPFDGTFAVKRVVIEVVFSDGDLKNGVLTRNTGSRSRSGWRARKKQDSHFGLMSGLSGLCRVNVGIVGILFHQNILSSPALLILFRENVPRTKIIQISQSSPINHAGKVDSVKRIMIVLED